MEERDFQAPLLRHSGAVAAAADGAAVEEGRPQEAAAPRGRVGAHWTAIAIILITDMVGIGTLGLPGDFARLGWIPALATMALFIGGGVYSGSIYQRLSLRVPRAVVFDEIGAAAMGEAGRWLVYTTVYTAILTEPCIFHLMTVESLQQALSGFVTLGWLPANLIVIALVLPLAQMHHLEDVAWVAIAGTVGMMVALAVVLAKLGLTYLSGPGAAAAAAARTELVAAGGSFFSGMVGVVDIAFSFGGQINWMRYITSISDRTRFNSAVLVTQGVMGALYLTTGAVGYAALGKGMDVHRPVSSVLPYDSWVAVINTGVFIHCLIAYQVM